MGSAAQNIHSEQAVIDRLNEASYRERNRDPEVSFRSATEALQLSEKSNYLKGKADALCNIGFYHLQLTEHEKSLALLLNALAIHEQIGDEGGIANTEYNLAVLQIRFANFDLALEYLHRCLAIREKQKDKLGLALCYFQMTYINDMFGNYDEGLEMGKKGLEIRRELNDHLGIAATLTAMGAIHRKKKEYETAARLFSEALSLRSAQDEIRGYFASLFQWIELNTEIGKLDEAKKYAEEGYKAALGGKEWFGVMRFCQQLGKIAMVQGNLPQALAFYTRGLEIAREKKFKSMTYELFELLSELHEQEGNYAVSLDYYKKFHRLKEEVLSAQSGSRLKSIKLMNQIESSKREAELERVKNVDLKNAFQLIEEKNKEILDSIKYASRIQRALITQEVYIEKNLRNLNP